MTYSEPGLVRAVSAAVTPSGQDLLIGRQVVLAKLADHLPWEIGALEDAWLSAVGGRRPDPNQRELQLIQVGSGMRPASLDDPTLMAERARRVIALVLDELDAERAVTPGPGDWDRVPPMIISARHPGGGGGVQIPDFTPTRYRAGSRVLLRDRDEPFLRLLSDGEYLHGLDDLLGSRGLRTLREARAAMGSRMFLSGASLIAASSEAAWWSLGRLVRSPARRLTDALEDGRNAAQVIDSVIQYVLEERIVGRGEATSVQAQGHQLRDVRNYALHPTEACDSDRELWLTEPGAISLLITSRRYFVQLAGWRQKLAHLQHT